MKWTRNTAGALAVALPVAALVAACSADSVTSPSAGAKGPAASIAPAPKPTPKPSAKDDASRLTLSQLLADTATWRTQSSDVEQGTDRPLPLTCGISGSYTVSAPMGPNGGRLPFGRSALVVPKGALTATTQITANITLGGSVQVTFQPHGLQFKKPVQIVADFTGCTVPSNSAVNVYYTNDAGSIAQTMPSAKDPAASRVTALTDHFSGYVVAWGRY